MNLIREFYQESFSYKLRVLFFVLPNLGAGFILYGIPLLFERPQYFCEGKKVPQRDYCSCQQRSFINEGFQSIVKIFSVPCQFNPQPYLLTIRSISELLSFGLLIVLALRKQNVMRMSACLFIAGAILMSFNYFAFSVLGFIMLYGSLPMRSTSFFSIANKQFGKYCLLIVALGYLLWPIGIIMGTLLSYQITNFRVLVLVFSVFYVLYLQFVRTQDQSQQLSDELCDKGTPPSFSEILKIGCSGIVLRCSLWYVGSVVIMNVVLIYLNTILSLSTQANIFILNSVQVFTGCLALCFTVESQRPKSLFRAAVYYCGLLLILVQFSPSVLEILFFVGLKLAIDFMWILQLSAAKQEIGGQRQLQVFVLFRGLLACGVVMFLPGTKWLLEQLGTGIYGLIGVLLILQAKYMI